MNIGIIYRAFNKITSKNYIGQTTYPLEKRIEGHYSKAKKVKYKFCNALNKYKKEDWEWSILKEVEESDLDYYEQFYILKFDSFKNGYNSTLGGSIRVGQNTGKNNHRYSNTIYHLYHVDYGEIKKSLHELMQIDKSFHGNIYYLVSGKLQQFKGFVLFENKERYDEICNIHEFFHIDHGIVKGNCTELAKKYNIRKDTFTVLKNKIYFCRLGWVLKENKDEYLNKINNNIKKFYHSDYGEVQYTAKQLATIYNLNIGSVRSIIHRKGRSLKGWIFIG